MSELEDLLGLLIIKHCFNINEVCCLDITTAQLVTTETILVLHAPDSSVEIISLCVLSVDLVASMHSTYFVYPKA